MLSRGDATSESYTDSEADAAQVSGEHVLGLTEEDWRVMGVQRLGHRKVIHDALVERRPVVSRFRQLVS